MDCSPPRKILEEPNIVSTSASGNIAFDLDVKPQSPSLLLSPRFTRTSSVPHTPRTLDEINRKLVEAEERRTMLEQERKDRMALDSKLNAVALKKEELDQQVRKKAEALLKGVDTVLENKERNIEEKVAKIKEHEKRVEEVRLNAREGGGDAALHMEQMQRAADLRKMKMDELMTKLKKQDERMLEVLARGAELNEPNSEDHIIAQIEEASGRRAAILQAIQNKQKQHLEEVAVKAAAAKRAQNDENTSMK